MSNALLSWDDFEDDTPVKGAINQDVALRAAENIKQLDTTEALKELEQQGMSIEHNKALKEAGLAFNGSSEQPLLNPSVQFTPEQLKVTNQKMMERARENIRKMDEFLEAGGRVNVAEKYLLNCQADLNQLVPFKYPEPWSLYLISCENHWMPAEIGIEKAAEELKTIGKGTPRKFIARFYFNYMHRNHLFSGSVLLNCYRLITNPECRQYLLRQAFENSQIGHAMTDFEEVFTPKAIVLGGANISQAQWDIDGWTFKNRFKVGKGLIPAISNLSFSAAGEANTALFLEDMVYLYGYINWTMQIVTIYQLMNTCRIEGKMNNLMELCKRFVKDIQSQTAFAKFFLSTAFSENPYVMTGEFVESIRTNMKAAFDAEFDLASTLANTDTEVKDVMDIVKYYINDFLNAIGIEGLGNVQLTDNNLWFAELVKSVQPHVNREAGLSGNGGSLEF